MSDYQIGKVYQAYSEDNDYCSLFEVRGEDDEGRYDIWCVNGAWDAVYDAVAETLTVNWTGKVLDTKLVEPYLDIGYGHVGESVPETNYDDFDDYIPF